MHKTIVFISILVLVALVLIGAGCGKKETGEEGAVPSGEESLTETSGEAKESLTEILGKAKDAVSYKYDMVITAPGQEIITAKFWLKEDKIRWEGIFEGKNVVYLIDGDEQVAYIYMPAQKMAMKMNFGEVQETVGESPTEQSESIEQYNPVILGNEVLDGKTCLVIEYSAVTDKVKMWLWTKYGIPIRTETITTKGTAVVEIKNIEFGDISDSMFELPVGVQPVAIPGSGF